ncbi:hypothetical protein ABE137_11180 [Brevibacillus laterosporus]|uniref:hypothetical protein n=1 Tax=Brevibacillus laterosporus TaxID=1465 RepID=UPI003D2604FC
MEKEVFNFLKNGDHETATYLVLVLIAIWLFKEIRIRYIHLDDAKEVRLDKTLEAYGALEISILMFLKEQNETTSKNLYESIIKSYSLVSSKLHKLLANYLDFNEDNKLREILKELRIETVNLKNEQSKLVNKSSNSQEHIQYYGGYLKTFIFPLGLTLFTLAIILYSIPFLYEFMRPENSWISRIHQFSIIISVIFLILFGSFVFDNLLENKIKHSWKNWLVIGGFIVGVIVPMVFKMSFISVVIIIFYIKSKKVKIETQ